MVFSSELAEGDVDYWIEDWYVETCGDVAVYPITFTRPPAGGTDVFVTAPRSLGESAPDATEGSLDPATAAALFESKPWFIEPGASADESVITRAVTEARFHENWLYVIVVNSEPDPEFVQETMTELGRGTLLVIGPETAEYVFNGGPYTLTEYEEAFERALTAATGEALVSRFVSHLIVNP